MQTYTPHTFRLQLPNAQQVALIGDFNNWHTNAHPLIQTDGNKDVWERIIDLPAGKHRYAFFVLDDLAGSDGAVRSRVVGNGSVLWVPEHAGQGVSITAHRSLAREHMATGETRRVA